VIDELEALLAEHDAFVTEIPIPNGHAADYFADLLRRLAETLDDAAMRGALGSDPGRVAYRVAQVLGAALFVAEMGAEVQAGSRRPATDVVARRFPRRPARIDHGPAGEG
jgi:hypothetical protein